MKQIIKSEFVTSVTETKMSRKELAAKYELPESEIKKIMTSFGLKISKKRHSTYEIVDDTVIAETIVVAITSVDETLPEVEQVN